MSRALAFSLFCVGLCHSVNLVDLTSDSFERAITNSDKHHVVLWRDKGRQEPDETFNAFEDAARQFQMNPGIVWAVVDTEQHKIAGNWEVEKIPSVQYFASKQAHPVGMRLPIGYNNPNVMSGITIDPGYIASKLRATLREAELKVLE